MLIDLTEEEIDAIIWMAKDEEFRIPRTKTHLIMTVVYLKQKLEARKRKKELEMSILR